MQNINMSLKNVLKPLLNGLKTISLTSKTLKKFWDFVLKSRSYNAVPKIVLFDEINEKKNDENKKLLVCLPTISLLYIFLDQLHL